MLRFLLIAISVLVLFIVCASPPKYHGQYSGIFQPILLKDLSGKAFTAVTLKVDSAKFSSPPPDKTIIGMSYILVNGSWNCYQPADFKTNRITIVGWLKSGVIKSPLSHTEISGLQNTNQFLYGALVVKHRDIYYGRVDQH